MRLLLSIWHFAQNHPGIASGISYAVCSNLVDLLNAPGPTSSGLYRKTYQLLHGLVFNWKTAIAAKLQPPPAASN